MSVHTQLGKAIGLDEHRCKPWPLADTRKVVREIPMRRAGWKTVIYSTGETFLIDPHGKVEAYTAPWL